MEQWELDFNWLKVQHFIKDKFNKTELPNLDTVLFMIGLQELGKIQKEYTKEDKLGITTLGICQVLSLDGYFEKTGKEEDGWPIWAEKKSFEPENDIAGRNLLKKLTIQYFEEKHGLVEYEQKI